MIIHCITILLLFFQLSSSIASTSNGLLVEFITDDNIEKKGFVFEYSATFKKSENKKLPVKVDNKNEPILND